MAREDPKRRILEALRGRTRTGERTGERDADAARRFVIDEDAVWLAHQRALTVVREGAESSQRITSTMAKQRGAVEAVADRARAASTRAQELSASFVRVVDAFERLGLVALNAGLEGARLGETAGRALLLVSDEVRSQTARGTENVRELSVTLAEIGSELAQLTPHLEHVREACAEVIQEATRATTSTGEADRLLVGMAEGLRKGTALDAETVLRVAEAGEHARALLASIGALTGRVPGRLLVGALKPLLEPLARILETDDRDGEAGPA